MTEVVIVPNTTPSVSRVVVSGVGPSGSISPEMVALAASTTAARDAALGAAAAAATTLASLSAAVAEALDDFEEEASDISGATLVSATAALNAAAAAAVADVSGPIYATRDHLLSLINLVDGGRADTVYGGYPVIDGGGA